MSTEVESCHQRMGSCSYSAIVNVETFIKNKCKSKIDSFWMWGRYPATVFGLSDPCACCTMGFIMLIHHLAFFLCITTAFSQGCIAHAAHEWIRAFQSPPHSLHQNVSRFSPSGVRSGISFLSGWQLWNTSLCLSHLACNLPLNFGIHSNYAVP